MDPIVVKKGIAAINTLASVVAAIYFAKDPGMHDAVIGLVANGMLVLGWVFLRRPGDLEPTSGKGDM